MTDLRPLDTEELKALSRALECHLDYWADEDTKNEAHRQAKAFGIEQFNQLLLSSYMAFFQNPIMFKSMWPNFEFLFSYGDLLKVTGEDADLLVVSTSDTFDFETLAKRAMNHRIAEREGIAYLNSRRPDKKLLSPSDLVFVPSRALKGLTYCFVPVFKQKAPYLHEIDPMDSRLGTEAVLDYLMDNSNSSSHPYRRVVMQILGHGRLKLNDGPIISEVWNVLQGRGKQRNTTYSSALERIELRVFGPRAVLTFLEIFVRDHEQLESFVQQGLESQSTPRDDGFSRGLVRNAKMTRKVFEDARKSAVTDSSIIICGPRGCGKHEVAKYVHASSRRSHRPFVRINCSKSTRANFERDLFGYVTEGRTGAVRRWPGQ